MFTLTLLLACSRPDPTSRLGPATIRHAPGDLAPDECVAHRRWVDRYAVVGTGRGIDAAVVCLRKLPEESAIPALTALLRSASGGRAARELVVYHGNAGCQAVFAAWEANDGPFETRLADALIDPMEGCWATLDLTATPRARALAAEGARRRTAWAQQGGVPNPPRETP